MIRQAITTDKLAPPIGPFSPAIRYRDLLFLSGQVAQVPATGRLMEGGAETQIEQILDNISAVLESAGKNFSDVIRVGIYLTDMADFAGINKVYARRFEPPYPARTVIGVVALPLGAAVEIDAVVG